MMEKYSFILKEREDALRCMRIMNGATIDGAIVEVSLSKPIDKSAMARIIRATPSPTSHLLSNAAAIMAAMSAGNAAAAGPGAPPVLTLPFPTVAALAAPIEPTSTVAQTAAAAANNSPTALSMQPSAQFTSYQTQSLLTTVPTAATTSQTPIR